MVKYRCPDCKVRFDLDTDEYEEGDLLNCPDCNLELVVEVVKGGKFKLRIAKDKEIDENEEFAFDEVYEDE